MSNSVTPLPISPYHEGWTWVTQHPATGSASGLAKLLLTLWSGGFSIAECLRELDDTRLAVALRVVNHFAVYERDAELVEIERHLGVNSPGSLLSYSPPPRGARSLARTLARRGSLGAPPHSPENRDDLAGRQRGPGRRAAGRLSKPSTRRTSCCARPSIYCSTNTTAKHRIRSDEYEHIEAAREPAGAAIYHRHRRRSLGSSPVRMSWLISAGKW